LVRETGYRSRIKPNAVGYLKVTEKEERMATQAMPRSYPSLVYVKQLVESIKVDNEIDLRDRALISCTLLSGMRDKAIATLPLGCFDEETLTITQNPRRGVDTKFAKLIPTTLFRFDEELFRIVIEWTRHLRLKGFGSQEPLFPRSRPDKGKDGLTFETANEVEPVFWQGTRRIREIFKSRSQKAGLPYFQPHTFRHLAINLAFKACKNGEEIKAISQNFGHEHIPTTLAVYGNYPPSRLAEIITSIDFSGSPQPSINAQIEELKKLIKSQKL
jgi:integrase/recombinase XerD